MANSIAYGFTGVRHLLKERISTVGVASMWTMLEDWRREHNRITDAMVSTLAEATTDHQMRVYLPGAGTLQPSDEWTTPEPIRPEGYYGVAYPLQGGATAWGVNRISGELMTVEEANRYTLTVEAQDQDWMRRHMLAALLYSSNWTFDDKQYDNLTIRALANNDEVVYLKRGSTTSAIDNHYLAQADAIDATHDPFPTIYAALIEHPSNMGPFTVWVASDQVSAIEALSDLVEVRDSEIIPGNASDTIALTDEYEARIAGFGTRILGRKNNMYIVEWPSLPSGILLAVARGAVEPVLKMRQYPAAALQGLYPKNFMPNESLEKFSYFRDCGFGVHNRVAAVVYQIGQASYTNPTGYTAMPLAI